MKLNKGTGSFSRNVTLSPSDVVAPFMEPDKSGNYLGFHLRA